MYCELLSGNSRVFKKPSFLGFYKDNFQVTYQVRVQLHRMMHEETKFSKNNNLSEKNNLQVNQLTWKLNH